MSKVPPLVSIVLISRDRPEFLKRALESIFEQDYRPLEIVLVDNQSSMPLETPPPPSGVSINQFTTPYRMNASEARNFATNRTNGDVICYLDDDDYYLPGKISAQVDALTQNQHVDIVYMNTQVYGPGGSVEMVLSGTPHWPLMIFIHLNALAVRRHVALETPFEERITKDVDDHFMIRIFERYPWMHIDRIGAVWNCDQRTDQITYYTTSFFAKFQNLRQKYMNSKIMCEDFAERIDRDAGLRKRYYHRHWKLALIRFRPLEAISYLQAGYGLMDGPRKCHGK